MFGNQQPTKDKTVNIESLKPAYRALKDSEQCFESLSSRVEKMRQTLETRSQALKASRLALDKAEKAQKQKNIDALIAGKKAIVSKAVKTCCAEVSEIEGDIALMKTGLEEHQPKLRYAEQQWREARGKFIEAMEKELLAAYEDALAEFCQKGLKPIILLNMVSAKMGGTICRPGWKDKHLNLFPAGEGGWNVLTGKLTAPVTEEEAETFLTNVVESLNDNTNEEGKA